MEAKKALQVLKDEFSEKKNSHIFLVETDDEEKALVDLKDIIKSLISKDITTDHQIDDETYLEMILIRPDGKDIKKDQIMELQNRLKTKPILSDYMVYIITPAEAMNEIAANKLLKTIEEPNSNVIGFMITKKIDILLPTIKSRCETISMLYGNQYNGKIPDDLNKTVSNIVNSIEKKDHHQFYIAKKDDKFLKENARIVEELVKDYYNTACNFDSKYNLDTALIEFIKKNNEYKTLIKKAKYINSIFNKLTKNMNFDLLLEKIFIELKDVK